MEKTIPGDILIKRIWSVIVFLLSVLSLTAGTVDIDSYLSQCHELGLFNGTVLVSIEDEVLFEKAYGKVNLNLEQDVPLTTGTPFNIGSLAKQFTAVIVFQLVEEGMLNLDDTLIDHLPAYREDTGKKVTIEHLLKHTSGIKSFTAIRGIDEYLAKPLSRSDAIIILHSSDLEFEPGADYKYNNTGYCLLASVIESVTGKTYAENLQARIIDRLNLKNTGVIDSIAAESHLARGTVLGFGGYRAPRKLVQANFIGSGGLYSTTSDLFLFNKALLDHTLLTGKYDEALFSTYEKVNPRFGHAVGWDIHELRFRNVDEPVKWAMFNGAALGYSCLNSIILDAPQKNQIILLTNRGHDTDVWSPHSAISSLLLGQTAAIPKKPVSQCILEQYGKKPFGEIMSFAEFCATDESVKYSVNEQKLNMLGYQLMWQNQLERAIQLFEMITRLFPESANAFDSLGEACMNHGKCEEAIGYYKKSLQLNPQNGNAREMLHKLESAE